MSLYLDYNSSSPILNEVSEALMDLFSIGNVLGNPSSTHQRGRKSRALVDEAKRNISLSMGYPLENIVFTSGATESINTVMYQDWDHVLFLATDHSCVIESAKLHSNSFTALPVDRTGMPDMGFIEKALKFSSEKNSRVLISITAANNETGVIVPYKQLLDMSHSLGCYVHIDAAQALGRVDENNWYLLGADFTSISSHKIGGLPGAGALLLGDRFLNIRPIIVGGGQQKYRRSGTENLAGIFSLGIAALSAKPSQWHECAKIRDYTENSIQSIAPEALIFGKDAPRVQNTTCFCIPGMRSDLLQIHLDLAGICTSRGSACSSGKTSKSHVISAMTGSEDLADCSLRVSLCPNTSKEDIVSFIDSWRSFYNKYIGNL